MHVDVFAVPSVRRIECQRHRYPFYVGKRLVDRYYLKTFDINRLASLTIAKTRQIFSVEFDLTTVYRRQLILTDKSQTNKQQVDSILSYWLTEKLLYLKGHIKYVKKKLWNSHLRMNGRISEYMWYITNSVVKCNSHCSVIRHSEHDDYYDLCTRILRNNNIIHGSFSSLV